MKLTANAKKKIEDMPIEMPLLQTDKDFMTAFLNLAADEVIEKAGIDDRTRKIAIAAGLVGSNSLSLYKKLLPMLLQSVEPEVIKEVNYQAVSYIGFAQVYPFIKYTNQYFKEHNISENLETTDLHNNDDRRNVGQNVMVKLFGEGSDQYPYNGPQFLKRMRALVTDNGFGDYYGRKTVSITERELITFCLLEALGGVHDELVSHTKTNLKLGCSPEFMLSIILTNIPYLGYPRSWEAVHALQEVLGADQDF